jgi:hypothetical protein
MATVKIKENQLDLSSTNAAISSKLDAATASSTYLTQSSASSIYLTQSDAASTYLDQGTASSTYLSQSAASSTYLTQADASSAYMPLSASGSFLTQEQADSKYLTQSAASSDYLTKVEAGGVYLPISSAASTYLTQSSASSTYLTQSSASSSYATQSALSSGLANKQDTLVAGTNIKTINDESLLGSGNIVISGGGGGSAPTFTTFTNKSGSSFDTAISGLASKTAMVFKNGLLLEKGESGIPTKIYRGGYTYGLTLTNTAPISTANSWEIRTVYTYDGGGRYPTVFGTSGSDFWKTPFMHLEDGVMKVWVSSNGDGTGAFILGVSLGLYPSLGETYFLKLIYDNVNGYKAFYSTTGFDNGTEVEISSNTTKAYCSVPFMFLNQLTGSQGEYNSNGSVNWTATKIIIDGQTWFDGAEAVENTDYINTGCVETIIPPASSITNDYAVSDSTISFATPLLTTDKITVGVF